MAAARGRSDLIEQIDRTRNRLAAQPISVVVVGEFKRGKSTLVNALLQTAVCPADPDLVTVVPTIVRYGEKSEAHAYLDPEERCGTRAHPGAPRPDRRLRQRER